MDYVSTMLQSGGTVRCEKDRSGKGENYTEYYEAAKINSNLFCLFVSFSGFKYPVVFTQFILGSVFNYKR